jgi:hypothetical protein
VTNDKRKKPWLCWLGLHDQGCPPPAAPSDAKAGERPKISPEDFERWRNDGACSGCGSLNACQGECQKPAAKPETKEGA